MTDLEKQIHNANVAYWQNNKPIMSDADYDALVLQLKHVYPNSPVLNEIGGVPGKYIHHVPMLSLNKAYTYSEVLDWIKTIPGNPEICIEPKYDGIAGKIENGRFVTRGNGVYGQDVTHIEPLITVRGNTDTPLSKFWPKAKSGPVLGEMVINLENFKTWFKSGKLLQQDGMLYANPRNAVAGIVNRKEILDVPEGIIDFCQYYPVLRYRKNELTLEVIRSSVERIVSEFKSRYPIDGVVFTLLPESAEYVAMGATAHHPKGAIAYKFGNNSKKGLVASVEWQQGREVLTPVLNLKDRLDFDDVLVSKATLHNYDQFVKASLHVGDSVKIERAGGVIPKFVGTISTSNGPLLTAPDKCPCCGGQLITQGVDLVCQNDKCRGKIVPRLVYSAKCLRIDGIGPKTAYLLYDKLGITSLYELLEYNYQEEISLLPGFTEYSADLLYTNVKNAIGTVYDWEVAASFGCPGIGPELFKRWYAKGFVWSGDMTKNTSLYEGMSLERSRILEKFWHDNEQHIRATLKAFKPLPSKMVESKGIICCTGATDIPRSELMKIVEGAGYTFTDKMTTNVKYLATNNQNSTSGKMAYAKVHNIPIISYQRLFEILGVPYPGSDGTRGPAIVQIQNQQRTL